MMDGFNAGSDGKGNEFAGNFVKASQIINDFQGVLFSLLMPFIAIGTWIMYSNKNKYNFTEHLVINLYSNSQIILFNFVLYIGFAFFSSLDFLTVSIIGTPITFLYGAFVFKQLHNSSFINAIIRYIGAYVIFMIAFFILMILLLIPVIIYLRIKN